MNKLKSIELNDKDIIPIIAEYLDIIKLELQEAREEIKILRNEQSLQWEMFSSTCELVNEIARPKFTLARNVKRLS